MQIRYKKNLDVGGSNAMVSTLTFHDTRSSIILLTPILIYVWPATRSVCSPLASEGGSQKSSFIAC